MRKNPPSPKLRRTRKNKFEINLLEKIEIKEVKRLPKIFSFKTHKIKVKDFFVPHAGNNHHPHILHTKRALFYSLFFVLIKLVVFIFTISIPLQAFMMPDVLLGQRKEIQRLVQEARINNNLTNLADTEKLYSSSQNKSEDMLQNSYFSHDSPGGKDLKYFLKQADYTYRYAGENLAMGFSDASSVVNAWLKSPLHYKNIIDNDFFETGLGISSGKYKGKETVFITQHFGAPIKKIAKAEEPEIKQEIIEEVVIEKTDNEVLGEKVEPENIAEESAFVPLNGTSADKVEYLENESNVFWKYDGKNTTFNIKAYIEGETENLEVYINDNIIKLQKSKTEENLYIGELTTAENIDNFFRPVITPTIIIKDKQGNVMIEAINWYQVKTVEQTPVEKYQAAKNFLPVANSIFGFSNIIYLVGAIILIIVLLLTILVEIKKQHPHVIVQTLALLLLLSTLLIT